MISPIGSVSVFSSSAHVNRDKKNKTKMMIIKIGLPFKRNLPDDGRRMMLVRIGARLIPGSHPPSDRVRYPGFGLSPRCAFSDLFLIIRLQAGSLCYKPYIQTRKSDGIMHREYPFTVAGQRRIHTVFPHHPILEIFFNSLKISHMKSQVKQN